MMPDDFNRLTIYEGDAVVVRINKFVNLSDTFVHNHTASFFSVVLRGAYNHKIFIEDGVADGSYFRYQRAKGGVMSQKILDESLKVLLDKAEDLAENRSAFGEAATTSLFASLEGSVRALMKASAGEPPDPATSAAHRRGPGAAADTRNSGKSRMDSPR